MILRIRRSGQMPLSIVRAARLLVLSATACYFASASGTRAESVEEFYKGKTITVAVGFSSGGSYDFYARLFARYMSKYIPGQPAIIVQNMPGAGSLRAANHLYNIAPKDGTALAVVTSTLMVEEPLGAPGVKFKANEFSYIGRMTTVLDTISSWHGAKAKTISDVRNVETTIGGTGQSSVTVGFPRLLNAFAGTKFRILLGFSGTSDLLLAMERGEIDAAVVSLTTLTRNKKDWLDQKKVNMLVQIDLHRSKEFPDIPTMVELGNSPDDKAALEFYTSTIAVGRSMMGAPGIPAERLKALRAAFMATINDPGFSADIKKTQSEFEPAPGEFLQDLANKVAATPAEVARRTAAALQGK